MKQTDELTPFQELVNDDTPVLVDFFTEWCGPCKMMGPILKELKSNMGDRILVIKIDTEKNPAAAIKYQVRGVPSLILFYQGHILWQQAGVVQAKQLQSIIEQKVPS
tara:strand:+ start:1853 stop:2173 length:321 start_codon:yes stop_codon:yes gene_type:complete